MIFVICGHFTDQNLKAPIIHEHTHQVQTYSEEEEKFMLQYL